MKTRTCSWCGYENNSYKVECVECGSELKGRCEFKTPRHEPSPEEIQRLAAQIRAERREWMESR